MASRSESAMKQRSNSSRLLAERRAASALPTPNVSTDRELMLRRSGLASASGSASRSLNISCNSETFHNWLSRASSAVSVRSDGSCLSSINAKNEAARCVSSSGHRRCQSSCGRPTRASMLRLNNSPIQNEQPTRGYPDMIKKRKEFTLRCKSFSASNVRCKTLPDGELLHAFITGARYNRAHNMDSRSLERVGLYIPRSDATRSFVNHAGTLPPSPEIYGVVKSRLLVSDNTVPHTSHRQTPSSETAKLSERFERSSSTKSTFSGSTTEAISPKPIATTRHQEACGYDVPPGICRQNLSLLIRCYHGNQVKDNGTLWQGDGVEKPCGQRPIISMKLLNNTYGPGGRRRTESQEISQDLTECAASRNEELQQFTSENCDLASNTNSYGSDLLTRVDHKHVNIKNSNSPQHSCGDPPTAIAGVETQTETSIKQPQVSTRERGNDQEQAVLTSDEGGARQATAQTISREGNFEQHPDLTEADHDLTEADHDGDTQQIGGDNEQKLKGELTTKEGDIGQEVTGTTPALNGTQDNDHEDELISPEARALIADEILKECQQSSSSFASSSVSHEAIGQDNVNIINVSELNQGERQSKGAPVPFTPNLVLKDVVQDGSPPGTENTIPHPVSTLRLSSQDRLGPDATAAGDLQGGGSELSAKSSCIFVDMSSLHLDRVQADDEIDQTSNDLKT